MIIVSSKIEPSTLGLMLWMLTGQDLIQDSNVWREKTATVMEQSSSWSVKRSCSKSYRL